MPVPGNVLRDQLPKGMNHFAGYYALLILFIASFILRLFLRSNYLDDWDSVQFALALNNYSLIYHQPHPPGYPVYIFFGRIIDLAFKDAQLALTFMSALFGSLCLIPTYLLARKFFDDRTAISAALILSLVPASLLFSEVAMSDIVSMFFITATIYLLWLSTTSIKYFYIAAFVLGITMGIRQTDFLLIPLFLITAIYIGQRKAFVYSIAIMLAGILLWLIPVILDTGLSKFIAVQSIQGQIAIASRTLTEFSLSSLMLTLRSLFELFISGWSPVFIVFLGSTLIAIMIKIHMNKKCSVDKRAVFMMAWIIPYLSFFALVYLLYIPRYILPIFPALAIVFAFSITTIVDCIRERSQRNLMLLFFAAVIILMGFQAISQAYALHDSVPAPVQAAQYIKEHYDPQDTLIVAGDSFRHFQYYLPEYTVKLNFRYYYPEYPVKLNWFTTADDLKNRTILSEEENMSFGNEGYFYQFSRDPNIYPKHMLVKIYTCNSSKTSQLVLKGVGWYDQEHWDSIPTRWMKGDATILLTSDSEHSANLSMRVLAFQRNRTLEISSGDAFLAREVIPLNFVNLSVPFKFQEGGNLIRLHVLEGCERPCDYRELNNRDCRCLSLAIQSPRISGCD